jgi:hypothetical protein
MQIILDLKTPTSYVYSLRKCIGKDGDLKGMNSHDYHIMMQDILHVCMKHLMEKGCRTTIIRVCHVFKRFCTKVVDPSLMIDTKKEMAVTFVSHF